MNNLVSIIVPVYNVECYLIKCLESLINQSYQKIEILLINDESTDSSLKICQKYEALDERIRLINQKNSGVSVARNRGLREAKGDYITFVDSDDFIELNMIESMLRTAIDNNSDITICSYRLISENDNVIKDINSDHKENIILNSLETLNIIYTSEKINGFLWNKMFKREIIQNKFLLEDLDICEDLYYVSNLLVDDLNVTYISYPFYNYRQNSKSATQNVRNLFNHRGDLKYLIALSRIEQLYIDCDEVLTLLYLKRNKIILETYLLVLRSKFDDININKLYFKLLRENKKYLFMKQAPIKFKIAYTIFFIRLYFKCMFY